MKYRFQYSVLLYRHDVITDERINVGIALYCPEIPYFSCKLQSRYSRITKAFPGSDGEFFKKYINRLQTRVNDLSERINSRQTSIFTTEGSIEPIIKKLLSQEDSSLFFSPIKYGVTDDPEVEIEKIFSRKVNYYLEKEVERKNDNDVWNIFKKPLQEHNVIEYLKPYTIVLPKDEIEFEYGWQNGQQNVLRPLTFDLSDPVYIKKKAHEWRGIIHLLEEADNLSSVYLLVGEPSSDDAKIAKAYNETLNILDIKPHNYQLQIYESSNNEKFAEDIVTKIEHDLKHFS